MVIKTLKIYSMIAGFILLSFECTKSKIICSKEGYEYTNETSFCWYSPDLDSVQLGSIITLEASIPKRFIDAATNTTVSNTASIVEGSLGMGMIYPIYQAAADSFELIAQIGKVIKDTAHFSEGILKGFRTIRWDGSTIDSFKMKITIKALARGIYSFALRQQSAKDNDCALYKYFLKVGSNQYLHYWAEFNGGFVDDFTKNYAYCFKVY